MLRGQFSREVVFHSLLINTTLIPLSFKYTHSHIYIYRYISKNIEDEAVYTKTEINNE